MGTDYTNPFTREEGKNDGEFWSAFFKTSIDNLPTKEQAEQPYKIECHMDGIETCKKCGKEVDMGHIIIVNPLRNMELNIPYIGLHYMENGCFSYWGDIHEARVNVDTLKKILFAYDPKHILPVKEDSDNDGLTDAEELYFGYDPEKADTNGDGVCDGMDLALSLTGILDSLPTEPVQNSPYIIHHYTYGFWNCLLCGEPINMGHIELFNPNLSSDSLQVSYYAYHFLKKRELCL